MGVIACGRGSAVSKYVWDGFRVVRLRRAGAGFVSRRIKSSMFADWMDGGYRQEAGGQQRFPLRAPNAYRRVELKYVKDSGQKRSMLNCSRRKVSDRGNMTEYYLACGGAFFPRVFQLETPHIIVDVLSDSPRRGFARDFDHNSMPTIAASCKHKQGDRPRECKGRADVPNQKRNTACEVDGKHRS